MEKSKIKFAFCGFDFFDAALLKLLHDGHKLCKIFSFETDGNYNSNETVKRIAEAHSVRFQTDPIQESDVMELKAMGCQLLIAAAYPFKIPTKPLEDMFAINLHPSLLPEGRGPWPLPHTVLKRLPRSGITIHKIAPKFDAGDILLQVGFPLSQAENLESLTCKAQMAAIPVLTECVEKLQELWANAHAQGKGSYWQMPTEAERSLNWESSVTAIDCVVRAFGRFESYANFDGKDWLVRDATVWEEEHHFAAGAVVHRTHHEVVIAALDGFVCLRNYVPESKNEKAH